MNVQKFLAIKIAEIASDIATGAEHIADHHAENPLEMGACQEELLHDILELTFLALIAQKNSLIPTSAHRDGDFTRAEIQRALYNEAVEDMKLGRLTGNLVI